MIWLFRDAPPAFEVLGSYLRGEEVDPRQVRHALETLLEAWDSVAAHAGHAHDKLGLPRANRVTREVLVALAEEVRVWQDRLVEEPLDTRMADDAWWQIEIMRPGK